MKVRIGMDQTTAWLLAILATGAVFGGLYFGLQQMAKRHQMTSAEEGAHAGAGQHGSEHGHSPEAPAGGHGEGDPQAPAAAHGDAKHGKADEHGKADGHGKADEHHAPAHGEEHGAIHEGSHDEEAPSSEHDEAPAPAGHATTHGKGHEPAADDAGHASGDDHSEHKAPEKGAAKLVASNPLLGNADWSYEGRSGPEFWGDLNSHYRTCQQGKQQSPVDIKKPMFNAKLEALKVFYKNAQLSLKNTGTTIMAPYAPGSYFLHDGTRYNLTEFHFHLPSEHMIEGIPYDMELHLVHETSAGKLGYIAVFMEEGLRDHTALETIWKDLPQSRNGAGRAVQFNASSLLPAGRGYYALEGSTTTPPCQEGVRWLVMKDPIKVSPNQLDRFISIYRNNARPLQALNQRPIHASSPS